MTQICKNCGHEKKEHRKGEVFHVVGNVGVRIIKCKKFEAKKKICYFCEKRIAEKGDSCEKCYYKILNEKGIKPEEYGK